MAGKLCFDANHPVLAAKETSIDCLETAARETDCGKTANTLKEAIHEHKTPAPREITGDDNNKDADSAGSYYRLIRQVNNCQNPTLTQL